MKWLVLLLLCGSAVAQTGPAFDAASVKPVPKEDGIAVSPTLTTRRLIWQTDLFYLNSFAWNVPIDRVDGIHGIHIVRIEATTSHDATVDEMRQMTRTLLAVRFKQKAHLVSKDVDGIALTLGKGGMKVKEAPLQANDKPFVSGTMPEKGVTLVTSHRATIDELADNLALFLNQPVWNRTGVTGTYDYTFQYAQNDDPAVDAPSLENALRDSLGFNLLKKQHGPVDFLVVDSMTTDPGAN